MYAQLEQDFVRLEPRSYILPTFETMATLRNTFALATALIGGARAVNNGLAITPPMGWVRNSKHLTKSSR